MYAWSGIGSPLPPSTVGVAETSLSVPPRGLQHWHLHFNWTAHTFNTEQSGIWAFWRDIPTNVPHMSETGSTLIDMMACSCNQLICTLQTYFSWSGESGNCPRSHCRQHRVLTITPCAHGVILTNEISLRKFHTPYIIFRGNGKSLWNLRTPYFFDKGK